MMDMYFYSLSFGILTFYALNGPASALVVEVSDPFPEPGQDVTVTCRGDFQPFDLAVLGKQTHQPGGYFETISANDRLLGKYQSQRFRLTQVVVGSTRNYTLQISDVKAEDTSIYVCINAEAETSGSVLLEVADAPSRIYFQDYEEGQTISGRDGDSVALTCHVEDVLPNPTVELMAAGNVVEPVDLTVTPVKDAKCTEENEDCLLHYLYDVSLETSNFILTKYFDDNTIQCRAQSTAEWQPVFSTLNANVLHAPYSDSPRRQELWLGQEDVTISIEINFNPQLSSAVTLFAFGQNIPPDTPVFGIVFSLNEITPKRTVAHIYLDVIMAFHFGGYIFAAENEEGSFSLQLDLVEREPVIETTEAMVPTTRDPDFGRITVSASRTLPDQGEPLIIRCDLSTRFTTDVQIWKSVTENATESSQMVCTNTALSPAYSATGRHSVSYSESGIIRTFQLFIISTTLEETAYYSCLAVDENDWATTLVEVNQGPGDLGFIGFPPNGTLSAQDGQVVNLDCAINNVAPVSRVMVYVGSYNAEEFEVEVIKNAKCHNPPANDCRLNFNYDMRVYTRDWQLNKNLNNFSVICQALYPPTNETLKTETLWLDISFLPYTLAASEYNVSVGQVNFTAKFEYKYNPDLTESPYLEAFGQPIYPGNTVFGVTFIQEILGNQESVFRMNISQVLEFHIGMYRIVTENSMGKDVLDVVLNKVDAPITSPTPPSTSQFPPTTTRNPDIVTISINVYPREGDNITVRCWQRHKGQAFFFNLRKQTKRDGGDYQQVAINNILFEPYSLTGRHQLQTYWNESYAELRLTIYDATEQDTAFYHCYSSLDESVDAEKSEVVHTPRELHWEGFETNGTVSGYYRDRTEVECWARNAAPSPRLMVYVDDKTQFYFRTASYQRDFCIGQNDPDCLLHYAYDAQIYSETSFRLERSYHTKALKCVSSSTNQDTLESLLFMNVTTEPYTDTYNYFYKYEGMLDFAMVFDLRYNPDLIYDVKFYSNNFEEYYPPGAWINGSLFYEEVISDNQRLIYFNISQIEDYHFGRYSLQTGNILGNLSLNIYLNSLGPLPKPGVMESLKNPQTPHVRQSHQGYRRLASQLMPNCHNPTPGCKRMFELPDGQCKCFQYDPLYSKQRKITPKFDPLAIASCINKAIFNIRE